MKRAIIDIGSNTINLIIAERTENSLEVIFNNKIHAKLAKGGINDGKITDEAYQRGLDAMKQHKATCDKLGVAEENRNAFATAAVRSAANGEAFVKDVYDQFQIKIDIISGQQEAEMIFRGVENGIPLREDYMILDIGGGSCEFIIVKESKIHWKESFPLGVSKMLDMFNISDPMPDEQEAALRTHFQATLQPLYDAIKKTNTTTLVGSSGSFDTIRAILLATSKKENDDTWMPIKKSDFIQLYKQLRPSSKIEREQIEGMDIARIDYMVTALIFIDNIITNCNIENLYQCSYALKEGAFFYFND